MEPVDYMSVGERIAIYRRRRGLSQVALANLIGRSEAWMSQVERGIRHVDRLSIIIRLAQVLRVTVEDLTGQPFSLAPNGGAEYRAIPARRAALTDYEVIPATLGTLTRDDGPVRDLTHLQRNVDQANRLYQAAHYEEAGLLLSRLIGETQRATRELPRDDHRAAFGVLAQIYHITAKTLTKVDETELAWIAAERSLPAVEHAESPLLMAASAYHLGHVFLRAGQLDQAIGVTMAAARPLEPGSSAATLEHLSAWGALHLTAVIAVPAKTTGWRFVSSSAKRGPRLTSSARTAMTSGPHSVPPTLRCTKSRPRSSLAMLVKLCARVRRLIPRDFRRDCLAGVRRSSLIWHGATRSSGRTRLR